MKVIGERNELAFPRRNPLPSGDTTCELLVALERPDQRRDLVHAGGNTTTTAVAPVGRAARGSWGGPK